MKRRIAQWGRTVATVGLAMMTACATLGPRPYATPTVASDDAVVAAPGCLPGTERIGYDTAGFIISGAFLGAIIAGPKASGQALKRDMVGGMVLGAALGTWLNAHRHCPDTEDALAH